MRESSEVQTGIGPIRMVSGDSCLLPHPHSQLAYTCTQTRLYTCQYPHPNNFCPPPHPHTQTHMRTCLDPHTDTQIFSLSHTHTHTHNARTHTLYFYVACILGWSVITAFFLHIPTPCTHTHTHSLSLSLIVFLCCTYSNPIYIIMEKESQMTYLRVV